MQNIYLVCRSEFYYQNRIFDLNNPANRDDCYFPYYLLRQKFQERNIRFNTYDYLGKNSDTNYKLLFFDFPKKYTSILKCHKNIDKYLVIFESEPMYSIPWKKELHSSFNKIFTWNDELIDNNKYIKYYWPNKIPGNLEYNLQEKSGFCCMITANKSRSHALELYSEREKAIRWFEQNHTEEFDLYGMDWDKYCFKGALSILNSFDILGKIPKTQYPSYKGPVKSKREVLRKYKFSICYENMRDIPGYITEKIFDCFFGGCVPVYWGAPNIAEQIPSDTFIDRRKFGSYEELYAYLKNMPNDQYLAYLKAIRNFVQSDKIYPFSAQCFVETIVREITGN
jgi:alpha(1,3/1,4) fucosyltransferase